METRYGCRCEMFFEGCELRHGKPCAVSRPLPAALTSRSECAEDGTEQRGEPCPAARCNKLASLCAEQAAEVERDHRADHDASGGTGVPKETSCLREWTPRVRSEAGHTRRSSREADRITRSGRQQRGRHEGDARAHGGRRGDLFSNNHHGTESGKTLKTAQRCEPSRGERPSQATATRHRPEQVRCARAQRTAPEPRRAGQRHGGCRTTLGSHEPRSRLRL